VGILTGKLSACARPRAAFRHWPVCIMHANCESAPLERRQPWSVRSVPDDDSWRARVPLLQPAITTM